MRWVFFCLLILNVVYLVWGLVVKVAPDDASPVAAASAPAGKRLVLLSEAGVTDVFQSVAPGGKQSLCSAVGPWSDRVKAEQALQELSRKGYSGLTRAVLVDKDRLHWVFLPSYPDRDEAMRVLRELQRRGVDSFIVADGEDANAVSLGYFSSPDSARGLMVKMKTAGYPAQIRDTVRQETEYWVYFDADGVPDGGQAARAYLAANDEISGKNAQCAPAIVPVEQLPETP